MDAIYQLQLFCNGEKDFTEEDIAISSEWYINYHEN